MIKNFCCQSMCQSLMVLPTEIMAWFGQPDAKPIDAIFGSQDKLFIQIFSIQTSGSHFCSDQCNLHKLDFGIFYFFFILRAVHGNEW